MLWDWALHIFAYMTEVKVQADVIVSWLSSPRLLSGICFHFFGFWRLLITLKPKKYMLFPGVSQQPSLVPGAPNTQSRYSLRTFGPKIVWAVYSLDYAGGGKSVTFRRGSEVSRGL